MSIEANYRRVTPEEFARLRSDPKTAELFFGTNLEELGNPQELLAGLQQQECSDRFLGIGKDWHALHFLLTGDGEVTPHRLPRPPLSNVVQGGTETEWPCTYGYVRFLTADEVRGAADALSKISIAQLRSRFDLSAFNAAQIYPHGRRAAWTLEDVQSVFEIYPRVVEFFQLAARAGDIILLSSD